MPIETFLYNLLNKTHMPKTIVLSLGGSLIFPDNLDKKFLMNFKKVIEKYIKKNYRFAIVCGGGRLARNMQEVASKNRKPGNKELDWIGIHATIINAHLLKSVFGANANEFVITNPNAKITFRKNVAIAAGWKPGWSTDYDAVLLAENLGIKEVVNMSNVDYVYDKDPRKHRNANIIEKISWKNYKKLISRKWKAGMNVPFDPIASKEAQKSKIKVYIIGKDLGNLDNLLKEKKFAGTIIE